MDSHQFRRALCCGVAATLLVNPVFAGVAGEPLTLTNVRALTLEHSPTLAGFAAEIRARDATARHAAKLPNPALSLELEDFAGTGDRAGVEQAETTLHVDQLIELGGKRSLRQRVAKLDHELASAEHQAKTLAVLSDATKAFIHALAAQERLVLAAQLESIARKGVEGVTTQVNAGAAPAVEITRARVVLGRSEIEKQRAEREVAATRMALAAHWGEDRPAFGKLDGDLTLLDPPPPLSDIERTLERNPDFARATTEADEREAALALEKSVRIPDFTVGAGGRHYSDNGDFGLVFALSAPLPIFHANEGGIATAQQRLQRAHMDKDAVRIAIRAALIQAHSELDSAYEQAISLRDGVLPTAQQAFDEARRAYQHGIFRFDDVLDTQRTLFTLRGDYLTALEAFHVAAAEVERLTGGGAPSVSPPPGGGDEEVR